MSGLVRGGPVHEKPASWRAAAEAARFQSRIWPSAVDMERRRASFEKASEWMTVSGAGRHVTRGWRAGHDSRERSPRSPGAMALRPRGEKAAAWMSPRGEGEGEGWEASHEPGEKVDSPWVVADQRRLSGVQWAPLHDEETGAPKTSEPSSVFQTWTAGPCQQWSATKRLSGLQRGPRPVL